MVYPDDLEDISYEQEDHAWLWNIYGFKNNDPGVQDSGSVVTREGRLVMFPNIIQQLPPSRLDQTRPSQDRGPLSCQPERQDP